MFLPIGCGYKIIDKTKQNNFVIADLNSTGDRRINYKLKNNLTFNMRNSSQNVLNLTLNSKKNKEVKEKNIKNQITKYKVSIVVNIKFNLVNSEKIHKIQSTKNGDYLVGNNHASTISNEKKLTDNLVETLSDDIKDKISSIINDL
tara:strand:+ start:461 stop:898 length:438 start_codon:yes stop_codon:yes gene_type:complete